MKRVISYVILLVFLCAGAVSCTDWLEVESKSNLSTDSFYKTPTEAEQALYGVYNGLMPLAQYAWFMSELRSDNVWADNAEDSATQRDYIDIFTFNPNLSIISTINGAWVDLYEIIARANMLLARIEETLFAPNEKVDIKQQMIAETRLLRGYAYFELVRYFGRVPVTTSPMTVEEAMSTPQSESVDIYNNVIIPDLKFAAETLTEQIYDIKGDKATAGRANKIAAQSLLGRVYLTMAGYPLYDPDAKALAKVELKSVIDAASESGKYWAKSGTEWLKMWISDNDNKYYIFEIQYVARDGYGNPMTYWTAPKVGEDYIGLQMSGYQLVGTTDLLNLLNGGKSDVRYDGTFDFEFNSTLTFFDKMFEHKKKREALGYEDISSQIVTRNYFPQNFPIIRLEDVMLMYAEIVGPVPEAVELVNKIRRRAGLDDLTAAEVADFDKTVADERRREFAGEGIRWHDLVRHNKYVEALRHKFTSYSTDSEGNITRPKSYAWSSRVVEGVDVYPIPDAQMKAKPGLYEQNPAYK